MIGLPQTGDWFSRIRLTGGSFKRDDVDIVR